MQTADEFRFQTTRLNRDHYPAIAMENRDMLSKAGVLGVSLIGDPGCGKTSIIAAMLQQPSLRAAAIIADPIAHRQEACLLTMRDRVILIEVHRRDRRLLRADDVQDALRQLNLNDLDVLLIETAGAIDEAMAEDLGQHKTVLVLSVAAGDDKPDKIRALVAHADAVVLTKSDLVPMIRFDFEQFHFRVRSCASSIPVIPVSAQDASGISGWIKQISSWRDEVASPTRKDNQRTESSS